MNTASFAGLFGYSFDRTLYGASKAAIVQLSESLALYLKPQGIGVTLLCPGPVATNIGASIASFGPVAGTRGPGAQFAIKSPEDVGELVADAILTDRFMLPTDEQVVTILERHARDWDGFIDETLAAWDEPSYPPMPN